MTPAHQSIVTRLLPALLVVIALAGAGCERSPAESSGVGAASVSVQTSAPSEPALADPSSGDPAAGVSRPAAAAGVPAADEGDGDEAEGEAEAEGGEELAGPAPPAAGSPQITFDSTIYDFGPIEETRNHAGSFHFRNTGDAPLVIEAIKPTCGCTAIDLVKRDYGPGEEGILKFTFDPTAPGKQRKYIDVLSNAETRPLVRLTVAADVQAFLVVRPRSLELGVIPYREETRATVTISCADGNFKVRNVRTTNDHLAARILSKEESAPRLGPDDPPGARIIEVVVSPEAPWGGLFSWLQMTVSGRAPGRLAATVHTTRIRINGQVFGALAAEPDTFRFGVPTGEPFERRIRLTHRDGQPFKLLEASVDLPKLPGAKVRAERTGEAEYELILTATGGEKVAHCRGAVTVKTDVEGEETIAIDIVGVVRRRE